MVKRKKGPTPKKAWNPMLPVEPKDIKVFTATEGERAMMFANDQYLVIARPMDTEGDEFAADPFSGPVHLSIRRQDRKPHRDWRDYQRIKNDICGDEREGVEIYPAESRVVDMANQYHIWVLPEGAQVPVGFFSGRLVMDQAEAEEATGVVGAVQRAPE